MTPRVADGHTGAGWKPSVPVSRCKESLLIPHLATGDPGRLAAAAQRLRDMSRERLQVVA